MCAKDGESETQRGVKKPEKRQGQGPMGQHSEALGRSHFSLMSLQVADRLDNTQIVKMVTRNVPYLHLIPGSSTVAQQIVMDIFATDKKPHPLFTLGIVSSIIRDFAAACLSFTVAVHPSCHLTSCGEDL